MTNPLVTIITVTYNSENYIEQAIKSVLQQSYQNFEYYIADDCSNDNTKKIVEKLIVNDNRITFLKNKQNLGQYTNRNEVVKKAKGKYIFFIDGDDIALNRGIELAVAEMEAHPNCGFGVVKTANPKYLGPLEINNGNAFKLEYFGGGFLNSSLTNNVYKTEVLKQYPLNKKFANADTYLRLEILKKYNVLVLINPIALWRVLKNQESKKISYINQLYQKLIYTKVNLIEDDNFNLLNKSKLKVVYYKILYKLIKLNILQLNISKALQLKSFFIDSFIEATKYFLSKKDNSFWNEYNFENVNTKIGK